jgi:hypothetical protein
MIGICTGLSAATAARDDDEHTSPKMAAASQQHANGLEASTTEVSISKRTRLLK